MTYTYKYAIACTSGEYLKLTQLKLTSKRNIFYECIDKLMETLRYLQSNNLSSSVVFFQHLWRLDTLPASQRLASYTLCCLSANLFINKLRNNSKFNIAPAIPFPPTHTNLYKCDTVYQ